jgi:hypothetical protein
MAGTVTISADPVDRNPPIRFALSWTSNASGDVSGTPTPVIVGTICKIEFVPAAGGSAPTTLYDVTLLDAAGVDVLAGQGANLSATVASSVIPGVPFKDGTTTSTGPCVVAEALNLVVANAGNAKSGQVIIYVR